VPALFQTAGGVHGDLYGLFAFLFSLPAQFALGSLRDAGLVSGLFAENATIIVLHYATIYLLARLSIAVWFTLKAKKQ